MIKSIIRRCVNILIKKPDVKSELTLEYFRKKYNAEVFIYPLFHKKKNGYDSFPKMGYQIEFIQNNRGSRNSYHINNMVFNLFPEHMLEDDETLEEVGYVYYATYDEAETAVIEILKTKFVNK